MRISSARCAAAAVALLIATAPAAAQRPMTIVDLLSVPGLGDPQLSPDGRHVLYTLSEPDWEKNERVSHVWRAEVQGGDSRQLTSGEEGESSPRWSPDGRWIAFLARRGDDEGRQLYLMPSDGGEALRLTSHEGAVGDPQWSPDGSAIYFTAAEPKSAELKAREEAKDDVYAFDEDFRQEHLWKVSVLGGEETRLTKGDYNVSSFALSRDGTRVAHYRAPNPLYGYADQGELWIMDAGGGGALQLTDNEGLTESGPSISPDNSRVLFTCGCSAEGETYFNDNLFVVPASGGSPSLLFPDFDGEVGDAAWAADGKSVYFTANLGVHSELFRGDPATGRVEQITDGEHSLSGWQYLPSRNEHVFSLETPTNNGDVWMIPARGGAPRQVTHVFDHLAADFRLPRQEKITWKGADGVTVEGILHYPLDYQASRRYPLVVQTHGGPAASSQFGFPSWGNYTPVLTAMGYAVLDPNYRGSTGYGDAFLRDMVGHYFQNAHLDVLAGVDYLIERGIAHPDSLAKMGWSAGGHMTNKIITFTDRFKAAASGAGAANWLSMYAQSDVRTYRTPWFGGTPWQEDAPIEVYWENSPLREAWKVSTPTIFLVGANDPRVPMPQSVEMYRALKSNGVPTHLYVAPREPHGWRELRHELFKVNAELGWFEKWVRGRDYPWETPPAAPAKATDETAMQR